MVRNVEVDERVMVSHADFAKAALQGLTAGMDMKRTAALEVAELAWDLADAMVLMRQLRQDEQEQEPFDDG